MLGTDHRSIGRIHTPEGGKWTTAYVGDICAADEVRSRDPTLLETVNVNDTGRRNPELAQRLQDRVLAGSV